jgi:hypothetical protein
MHCILKLMIGSIVSLIAANHEQWAVLQVRRLREAIPETKENEQAA